MDPTDRRVVRTRRLLGEALLGLIQEQTYDSITIRDITERADIGYATFFRHYGGKEELLSEKVEQMIRELEASLADRPEGYFEQEGTLFFQAVADNLPLYEGLLGGQVNRAVFTSVRDALVRVIVAHLKEHAASATRNVPLPIAANHMAASALELVAWWLENERPYPPAEMGRIYDRLIVQATLQATIPAAAAHD